MQITHIETTPLFVPYSRPYYWSGGVVEGAEVILVEVQTDTGVSGFGESIASPSPEAIDAYLHCAARLCIGHSPFENAGLMAQVTDTLFHAFGTGSAPRFAGQVLAGLEMALWDVMGKATGRPVHELLGGAVRKDIAYFGFAQGQAVAEVVADARQLADGGFEVIYFKMGRGDAADLETISRVRAAVGPDVRLRVDPNERWSPLHASRMIRRLEAFNVEVVEQPTPCENLAALAQVRANSPIAISADQAVFTPADAYEVCRQKAADLIVIGLHETGGLLRWSKVAHIAAAAGLDVCIHGLFETGITACASNQVAATVTNLDDANQHMTRFLEWDLIRSPDTLPRRGRLPVFDQPGLGFELDREAVERGRSAYRDRRKL